MTFTFTMPRNCFIFFILCSLAIPVVNANIDSSSASDIKSYREFCLRASSDDETFRHFKQNPVYRSILEHVSYEQGLQYLQIIKQRYPELLSLWPKFSENDSLGDPITFSYESIGKCSPTTLRYVKTLGDLENLFGSLNGKKIIEIGGGYGGQCKIICDKFFPQQYTIVDLKEPVALMRKYLTALKVTQDKVINMITPQETETEHFDLFISNYSFSECNIEVQKEYLEKYLLKCSAGYMLFNTWEGIPFSTLSCQEIQNILTLHGYDVYVFPEEPLTAPQNVLIIWYK